MAIKQKMKKRIIKKNSKSSKKAKNELTQSQWGTLFEEINSKLDLLLEGHSDLNNKVNVLDDKVNVLDQKVDRNYQEMNSKFDEVNSNFKTVFEYLSKIDDNLHELQFIKSELAQIKSKLSKKADLDYIEKIEQRVNKIEMDYIELRVMVKERK